LFGLTGGIASGKSTVAAVFRAHGVPVIDADEVSRAVTAPGTEGHGAVVEAFGRDVLALDGTVDRKALGRVVFADAEQRAVLERILHPRIAAQTQEIACAYAAEGATLVAYEAALLVERGLADAFRPLVVVICDEAAQLARLYSRDGLSETDARARIAAQASNEQRLAAADIVIRNDGAVSELEAQAAIALRAVRSRMGAT
jgi:dephospho-CoA kinase